jgi:hypothetical protein
MTDAVLNPILVNKPHKDFHIFFTGVEIILDGGVQRGTDIAKVFYSILLHLRFSQIILRLETVCISRLPETWSTRAAVIQNREA